MFDIIVCNNTSVATMLRQVLLLRGLWDSLLWYLLDALNFHVLLLEYWLRLYGFKSGFGYSSVALRLHASLLSS
jgi:hypothetical protein